MGSVTIATIRALVQQYLSNYIIVLTNFFLTAQLTISSNLATWQGVYYNGALANNYLT